eukprot:1181616-Prorocentrum_minimum.AAC.3
MRGPAVTVGEYDMFARMSEDCAAGGNNQGVVNVTVKHVEDIILDFDFVRGLRARGVLPPGSYGPQLFTLVAIVSP